MEFKIKKIDLPIGELVEVSQSPKVIVFNNGEKYFAVSGICPHAKWPLEMGTVKEKTLTCAGHGWEFDITSGECKSNPRRDIKKYQILENDDHIIISDSNLISTPKC